MVCLAFQKHLTLAMPTDHEQTYTVDNNNYCQQYKHSLILFTGVITPVNNMTMLSPAAWCAHAVRSRYRGAQVSDGTRLYEAL